MFTNSQTFDFPQLYTTKIYYKPNKTNDNKILHNSLLLVEMTAWF